MESINAPQMKDTRPEIFFQLGATPNGTERARNHCGKLGLYSMENRPRTQCPPEAGGQVDVKGPRWCRCSGCKTDLLVADWWYYVDFPSTLSNVGLLIAPTSH